MYTLENTPLKGCTHRRDRRFPLHDLYTSEEIDRSSSPDLYDMYDLAYVVGWGARYYLHDILLKKCLVFFSLRVGSCTVPILHKPIRTAAAEERTMDHDL